jgi:hypothetical protein
VNEKNQNQVVKSERLIVQEQGPMSYLMDTARFEHLYRVAQAMASSSFLPKHLVAPSAQQTVANCFRILNQAMRWGMDPFAVIDETYAVHGRLGYQGKLVAAVINARSNLHGGLKCIYNTKKGDDFAVVIFGAPEPIPQEAFPDLRRYAQDEDREALAKLTAAGILAARLSVAQGKTDNQMWRDDPEQKLWYSGVVKWARRHRPEIILGVVTDEDMERIRGQLTAEAPERAIIHYPNRTEEVAAKLGAGAAAGPTQPQPQPQPQPPTQPEPVPPPGTPEPETPPAGDDQPAEPGAILDEQLERDDWATSFKERCLEAVKAEEVNTLVALGIELDKRKEWLGHSRYSDCELGRKFALGALDARREGTSGKRARAKV